MRTRHWKQLVRVIGGNIPVDNNGLTNLSFNTLLKFNLQCKLSQLDYSNVEVTTDVYETYFEPLQII